ncbi:TPA: LOW QUALITY PROTEIN: hypothetical protein N0F65_005611 [Lagenidium giganteum]|uniref:CST complex subunit CTC1 n=1 Tax=Lagenidium giganteum TaxID=4803 RepID=A0AAV2Z492_9STRA|nr:TPA: LOW QUALITY PROTEIN: hypothetical protein N0F65_005611 [Lagenidium giganteum]
MPMYRATSTADELHILALWRFLELVLHTDPRELACVWGINTTAVTQHVGDADEATACKKPRDDVANWQPAAFTSSRVWLTGWLRAAPEATHQLCLSDARASVPVRMFDPQPTQLDQLVLVKAWTYIAHCSSDRREPSAVMEVSDVCILVHPETTANITARETLTLLQTHCAAHDPPVYSRTHSWNAVLHASHAVAALNDDGKTKKRRVHAVFGRISAVSPISLQKEAVNSHFFVEVEHLMAASDAVACVASVNVMFAGESQLRWHSFCCPGKVVAITDLVKIYSQDCKTFLLQTTTSATPEKSGAAQHSRVLMWPDECILDIKPGISSHPTDVGLVTVQGKVRGLIWDGYLELNGEPSTLVCCFHRMSMLRQLRVGAIVRVCNAHVLQANPCQQRVVLALCHRSSMQLVAHGEPSAPFLVDSLRRSVHLSLRKWSALGDISTQSQAVSTWFLSLFQALSAQFHFDKENEEGAIGQWLTLPGVGRREACVKIGAALGLGVLEIDQRRRAATLGHQFLLSHSADVNECPSVAVSSSLSKLLLEKCFVTIKELKEHGARVLGMSMDSTTTTTTTTSAARSSVTINATDLNGCILLGFLDGNAWSGDFQLCDRTGSLPLLVRSTKNERSVSQPQSRFVVLTCFQLVVQRVDSDGANDPVKPHVVCAIQCSLDGITFLADLVGKNPEDSTSQLCSMGSLSLLVTHVDPIRQPRTSPLVMWPKPLYRHVRGVLLDADGNCEDVPSGCAVELLLPSSCVHGCVVPFGCYRVDGVTFEPMARPIPSHRESAASANIPDTTLSLCLDSLRQQLESFETQISGARPLLVAVAGPTVSVTPIRMQREPPLGLMCEQHAVCQRPPLQPQSNLLRIEDISDDQSHTWNEPSESSYASADVSVPTARYAWFSVLEAAARRKQRRASRIRSLYIHNISLTQANGDGTPTQLQQSLHQARFVTLVGMVVDVQVSRVPVKALSSTVDDLRPIKRGREDNGANAEATTATTLLLRCSLRDVHAADTAVVHVNATAFGLLAPFLVRGAVVRVNNLQHFVARSTYKVYLNWCNVSSVQVLARPVPAPLSTEALYATMTVSLLHQLYEPRVVDRAVHKWHVRVVHLNYVVLKRKCARCHQALTLERRSRWTHATNQNNQWEPSAGNATTSTGSGRRCWHLAPIAVNDEAFDAKTYLSTALRCIVDDGSAQAEVFFENDVAWALLHCSAAQRQRYDALLRTSVAQLSYFATRTASAAPQFFRPTRSADEQEYYENEFRGFVRACIDRLRPLQLVGHRIWTHKATKNEASATPTAVLSLGADIHITTKSLPMVQLEARDVQELHPKQSARQLLVHLIARASC